MDAVPEDAGLWIAPCEAIHTFGMRTPIDALFLGPRHDVRKLAPRLKARRMAVCLTAHSVLELAPGTVERSQTAVGDLLAFEPVSALQPRAAADE